jgi:hypothetical protein
MGLFNAPAFGNEREAVEKRRKRPFFHKEGKRSKKKESEDRPMEKLKTQKARFQLSHRARCYKKYCREAKGTR